MRNITLAFVNANLKFFMFFSPSTLHINNKITLSTKNRTQNCTKLDNHQTQRILIKAKEVNNCKIQKRESKTNWKDLNVSNLYGLTKMLSE